MGLFIFKFFYAWFEVLFFLGLKWGFITRDGWPYYWEGVANHTMWFLVVFAIDSLKFLFVMKWFEGWLSDGRQ